MFSFTGGFYANITTFIIITKVVFGHNEKSFGF